MAAYHEELEMAIAADPIEAAYFGLVERMADVEAEDVDEVQAQTILVAAARSTEQFTADIETARQLRADEARQERETREMFDRHTERAIARQDVLASMSR